MQGFAGLAIYSGTKFFQEVVSEVMRQEVASHNIKVSCIAPGDVSTGLHEKCQDKEVSFIFLCSDEIVENINSDHSLEGRNPIRL